MMPTLKESLLLAQALKKAELEQKNKQAAKEQLLRIQLLLSKRTT
jgi:hypothetical protein